MRIILILLFGLMDVMKGFAQEPVHVVDISPTLLIFETSTGNVIASVGPDGALLVGTPSASSTDQISRILEKRTSSPVRYVVIAPERVDESEGDAGWGRKGAFVVMQEKALERIGGHAMGAPPSLPEKLHLLGVDRPRISFSEVVCFDLNGEATHVVHQSPGFSDADAIVHYHVANMVYLGEVFPGDGYPLIDRAQNGTLSGLIKTLSSWTGDRFKVVPARGATTDGATVQAFLDMITKVRDRIRELRASGQSEDAIVASHPTAEFDARWGHGRESPEAFVREIYENDSSPTATR
jgi:cyclase